METLLMIVTIVALALALGMSAIAWRLLKENRRRTAARAETLAALAAEEDVAPARFAAIDEDFVRPARSEVPQFRGSKVRQENWDLTPIANVSFGTTVAAPAGAPKRRWLALAAVCVVMAALVSGVYMFYRPVIAAESRDASTPASAMRSSGPRPLELLSLRHSTESDGTFAVTGLVQNPPDGLAVQKVVAVVYVFDRDGNYFASGKASLDFTVLHPGDESPFVVRVPNVTRVSRYRVGFRSEEGGIVAHIDRRGQLPGGTTGNSVDAASTTRRSN